MEATFLCFYTASRPVIGRDAVSIEQDPPVCGFLEEPWRAAAVRKKCTNDTGYAYLRTSFSPSSVLGNQGCLVVPKYGWTKLIHRDRKYGNLVGVERV